MKTKDCCYSKSFAQWVIMKQKWSISFFIIVFMSLPVEAILEGDPELLRMTARAMKDNIGRVGSWQGRSQVESIHEDAIGIIQQEKSLYEFIYSRKEEATRWKWTGQERYIRKDEEAKLSPINWPAYDTKSEMRKGEGFYICASDYITNEREKQNSLVILPKEKAEEGVYSYSFDPMWYLKGRVADDTDDLSEMLMFFYKKANDPNFAPDNLLKVKRDGNLVVFDTGLEGLINRYTFDLSKSGFIVEYYGESNEGVELRKWSYEKLNGIWIPKSFSLDHKTWSNTKTKSIKTRLYRKVNFLESILNEQIPSSEFSLDKIGVTVGTPVSDHLLGLFYYYGGNKKFLLDNPNILVEDSSSSLQLTTVEEPNIENQQNNDKIHITNDEISDQSNSNTLAETRQDNYMKIVFIVVISLLVLTGIVSFILLKKNWIKL